MLFVAILLAGCGPAGPAIFPVAGRVTLDGKPLTQGIVCFVSEAGYLGSVMLGPQGEFRLASQDGQGIPRGLCRVTGCPPESGLIDLETTTPAKPAVDIHARYRPIGTSGLRAQVDAANGYFPPG